MSQTYIAWNGDEYPWPPPPNWYKAADGRWWAPNSGPSPEGLSENDPASSAPQGPDVNAPGGPSGLGGAGGNPVAGSNITDVLGETRLLPDDGNGDVNQTAQQPAISSDLPPVEPRADAGPGGVFPNRPNPGGDPAATRLSDGDSFQPFGNRPGLDQGAGPGSPGPGSPGLNFGDANPTAAQAPVDAPTVAGFNAPGGAPPPQRPTYGAEPASGYASGPPPKSSGGSKLPLIIAAAVAGLALLGLLIFFLTRGGDETASTDSTAVDSATTTVDSSSTTAEATTTTTPEETTTTEAVDQAAALEGFRGYLTSINIVGLDDTRIAGIGQEACTAALLAADRPAWDVTLADFVENITAQQQENPPAEGTPLESTDIENIYNGATTFYCPAQAERLGISV